MDGGDRTGDLMDFLMSSHTAMPAASMNGGTNDPASSAASTTGVLARTLTPAPVKRQLSLESETTQILGGPYRRGATIDSNMGLTPPAAMKTRLESPASTPRQTSEDPSLSLEIDKVSRQLKEELKVDKSKSGKAAAPKKKTKAEEKPAEARKPN